MKTWISALAASLILGGSAAFSQTPVTYTEAGRALFNVTVPDFWSVRTGGPQRLEGPDGEPARNVTRVIAAQPTTEDGVWMGFLSPRGVSSFAAANAYLRDVEAYLAFDAQTSDVFQKQMSGRTVEVINGTGRRNGVAIQFSIIVTPLPGRRVAISAAVIEAGTDPAFVDQVRDVLASLRPAQ